ncbi:chorismate transformation enzyme, FkbO/Hyg5 family [Rhizobacter fulvus]
MSVVPASARELAVATEPLLFRRVWLDAGAPPVDAAHALGGRVVGHDAAALNSPLLARPGPAHDWWLGGCVGAVQQHGCVQFVTDGDWLHGVAEIDDQAVGLQAASHRAYTDLFAVLAQNRSPNLLRLWNYLADINRETGGSERYRQFNAGRQQAFIEARRSAFEGSPAACALGTRDGPLRVYFLAGRRPPLAIENPRQVSAYRYPDTYGPRSPTFSRAALVDAGGGRDALFISGTASIVGHATVHIGDVKRQTEESLLNIDTVRQVAAERAGVPFPADALSYTVYVRRADDLAVIREVFEQAVGADTPAARDAIYLQADICRSELLVEIEAHGFALRKTPA